LLDFVGFLLLFFALLSSASFSAMLLRPSVPTETPPPNKKLALKLARVVLIDGMFTERRFDASFAALTLPPTETESESEKETEKKAKENQRFNEALSREKAVNEPFCIAS